MTPILSDDSCLGLAITIDFSDAFLHERVPEPSQLQSTNSQNSTWKPQSNPFGALADDDSSTDSSAIPDLQTQCCDDSTVEDMDALDDMEDMDALDDMENKEALFHPHLAHPDDRCNPDWKEDWMSPLSCAKEISNAEPVPDRLSCPLSDPILTMLPSQEELDHAAASSRLTQSYDSAIALMAAVDIQPLLLAPHKLHNKLKTGKASFEVVWDSGASHCITNDQNKFTGPIRSAGIVKKLTGLASGLDIKGVGTVSWSFHDRLGNLRTLQLPAYYVPKSPVKLLSTAQLLQHYPNESIELTDNAAILSGVEGDSSRNGVIAFVNPASNIPSCTGYRMTAVEQAAMALNVMTTTVDPSNMNLSDPKRQCSNGTNNWDISTVARSNS